jgi:tricorn protease
MAAAGAGEAHAQETRLLRQPTVSERHIAFAYANDIWIAHRDGGEARRITSFPGTESEPSLSPDGSLLAFSGQYGGNTDVFVVPVQGGEPERLTWHPGDDLVRGWTPDGSAVIFMSGRTSVPFYGSYPPRFWTVSPEGGLPEVMPMPRAARGEFSPDGGKFAYQPILLYDVEWRNYRGGQNRPIWVLDMQDYNLETLPWDGSRDTDPVWLGETIYFLSDRDTVVNLYGYHFPSGKLEQLTHHELLDVKRLAAGGGVVIYEHAGLIHLYDPTSGQDRQVAIQVRGDFPWALPHWEEVGEMLTNASLSPTGVRALFEARGEIFTVPTEKGDWRNLTRSSGVADRDPVWSPDGKTIAWFSDAGGEYRLMIGTQDGLEEPRAIEIEKPSFYFSPAWSPDSKLILFTDNKLNLWHVEVETGKVDWVDADQFVEPTRTMNPVWSPDSQWIAYVKRLDTHFHAVFVYSVESGASHQLTDGLSDVVSPAWDAGGKYLYFLASTNFALNSGWLDMSRYERPVERGIYVAVLAKDEPSPLLPESDEEKGEDDGEDDGKDEDGDGAGDDDDGDDEDDAEGEGEDSGDDEDEEEKVQVVIDFEGIDQRILSLEVATGEYFRLAAAGEGVLFVTQNIRNAPGSSLHKYSLEEKELEEFLPMVQSFVLSADGKKLLYGDGQSWSVVGIEAAPEPGKGKLETESLKMKVDPPAEWRQIFREAWRLQRDFFYVENLHGADWEMVWETYSPWLDHVRHRSDLTYLLDILGGELSVGHSFTGGGDNPDVESVSIGLLGADLEEDKGRYRLARIFTGENWNPDLRAPLSAPGIDIAEGNYILEVNGRELTAPTNPYSLFEETADRQTRLRVNDKPSPEGSRVITVVPVANEWQLRRRAWVEDNRRKVDEMSDGRLAYVFVPNTAGEGYTFFNRYYFAQQDREGAIIDERFNGGGSAADYLVDIMARDLHGYFNNPSAGRKPFTTPGAGIWGPKVMIINESAGSGGDLLPYLFRKMEIGPLVGMRTWGGLVGIWDTPGFIDGGAITAPRGGFFDLDGEWVVENVGVPPDIEVEQTPREVINGGDPQLERAVEEALRLLETEGVELLSEPPPPVRVKRP